MKVHPNHKGIDPTDYFGMMAPLNDEGGLLFMAQSCKESLCAYFLGNAIAPGNSTWCWMTASEGTANLDEFQMMFQLGKLSSAYTSFEERAEWVRDAMDMLSEAMSEKIETSLLGDKAAVIISGSTIYQRSSIAMHGIMSFVRAAAKGIEYKKPHPTDNIDRFISSVINYGTGQDAGQFQVARFNGNLQNFLDKECKSMTLPGYEGWLRMDRRALRYDGIVSYKDSHCGDNIADAKYFRDASPGERPPQRLHNNYRW